MMDRSQKKPGIRRDRPPPKPRREEPRRFLVPCTRCKTKIPLAFEPPEGESIFCPDCYHTLRHPFGARVRHGKTSVRASHELRKLVKITCSTCGKTDQINFRIQDPTKALCNECFERTHGLYQMVVRETYEMKPARTEMKFSCSRCGEPGFVPVADREALARLRELRDELTCYACRREQERKRRESTRSARRIGAGGTVIVRHRRGGSSGSSTS